MLTLTSEFPKQPGALRPARGSRDVAAHALRASEALSEGAATCVPLFTARPHLQRTHSLWTGPTSRLSVTEPCALVV